MDIRAALITGADIPYPEAKIIIRQPALKEIAMVGEEDFFPGVQTICLYKSMFENGDTLLKDVTNFEIFLTIMQEKQTADKKLAVQKVLSLILPNFNILFTPRALVLSRENETITIDDSNFEGLQDILRNVFCMNTGPMDQRNFNPSNSKAREIAEKIMKGRQKVAEEKGQANASILQQYISTLSIAMHLPIFDVSKYTMFQLYDQVERFGLWSAWDLDTRSRLAGGGSDDKPENWMKNIH